jgi:hypothetical protein
MAVCFPLSCYSKAVTSLFVQNPTWLGLLEPFISGVFFFLLMAFSPVSWKDKKQCQAWPYHVRLIPISLSILLIRYPNSFPSSKLRLTGDLWNLKKIFHKEAPKYVCFCPVTAELWLLIHPRLPPSQTCMVISWLAEVLPHSNTQLEIEDLLHCLGSRRPLCGGSKWLRTPIVWPGMIFCSCISIS